MKKRLQRRSQFCEQTARFACLFLRSVRGRSILEKVESGRMSRGYILVVDDDVLLAELAVAVLQPALRCFDLWKSP